MNPGRPGQGNSQAKRVRQLLSYGESLVAPPEGLVRIAQRPQGQGPIGEAGYSGVQHGTVGAALLRVVEGNPLLQVLSARDTLAKITQSYPQRIVGPQEERRALCALGQGETLLSQFVCRL